MLTTTRIHINPLCCLLFYSTEHSVSSSTLSLSTSGWLFHITTMLHSSDEKKGPPPDSQSFDVEHDAFGASATAGGVFDANEEHEVFKTTAGVNFRTVEWPRATVIFLKVIFAVGVLTIPTAMYDLGAVGGTLSVIGWGLLNTWAAVIQGDFRNNHRGCHGIADMAEVS